MNDFDYLFLIIGILEGIEDSDLKLHALVALESCASDKALIAAVAEARYEILNPTKGMTFMGIPVTVDPKFHETWGHDVGAVFINDSHIKGIITLGDFL